MVEDEQAQGFELPEMGITLDQILWKSSIFHESYKCFQVLLVMYPGFFNLRNAVSIHHAVFTTITNTTTASATMISSTTIVYTTATNVAINTTTPTAAATEFL